MRTDAGYLVDLDTSEHGTGGPYEPWEDDFTSLVHVLWDAKAEGLALDNAEDPDRLAGMILRSRWLAAARARGSLAYARTTLPGLPVDGDTRQFGTGGPFQTWESDHAALVQVLWSARHAGRTLAADTDAIASLIVRSRWMAAARAAGPLPRHAYGD